MLQAAQSTQLAIGIQFMKIFISFEIHTRDKEAIIAINLFKQFKAD